MGKIRPADCVDKDGYNKLLYRYTKNVKEESVIGADTFMMNESKVGSKEMFYMNTLRRYIYHIATITVEKHGLGFGIFDMKEVEQWNKENKNCYIDF